MVKFKVGDLVFKRSTDSTYPSGLAKISPRPRSDSSSTAKDHMYFIEFLDKSKNFPVINGIYAHVDFLRKPTELEKLIYG